MTTPVASFFNPSDSGSNITVSSITYTDDAISNVNSVWNSSRCNKSRASGRYYFELLIANHDGTNGEWVGMANSSFSTSTWVSNSATSCGMDTLTGTGTIAVSSGMTANFTTSPGFATNDIAQIAVDLIAGKLWYGKNNTWVNSGVPSSGTNPTITWTPPLTLFPVASSYHGGEIQLITTGAKQKYIAPARFSPWDTPICPGVTAPW